ncbi:cytochrome P450 [Streptomyces litchfieldiae]|uniref:Cytochrome P450 n=1 Tax=Streptomyces litchfieldiae TaxID=3075543 RepID=A0ABU2MPY0_9ACTN|nr:cytochrome P450 [Streptomyces sp. DSM 44938]MDT0343452.1 cytochrome P450 [Streptomyces sp. DSM 44938]
MDMTAPNKKGTVRDFPFVDQIDKLELEPILAELRREEPISRVRLPYGGEAWLLTRYHDVRAALADPRLSRAATVHADVPRRHEMLVGPEGIMYMDPPNHTRLRKLIGKAFTKRRVEALRPRVEVIAGELADELAAKPAPGDVAASFSWPLPTRVICELLGVPYADRAIFREGADAMMLADTLPHEEFANRAGKLIAYIRDLIAQRRAKPTEDMLTALVHARDNEDRLDENELVSISLVLLTGGHETTATQITNSIYTLLRHPDQLARLRADRGMIRGAVDELLRFMGTGSGHHEALIAMEPVEIGGHVFEKGEAIFVHVNSANYDEEVFENPETLDIGRKASSHMSFGHGIHYCLGAQLATMELNVALETLLDRFPRLALAGDDDAIRWRASLLTRGPETLPVTW